MNKTQKLIYQELGKIDRASLSFGRITYPYGNILSKYDVDEAWDHTSWVFGVFMFFGYFFNAFLFIFLSYPLVVELLLLLCSCLLLYGIFPVLLRRYLAARYLFKHGMYCLPPQDENCMTP